MMRMIRTCCRYEAKKMLTVQKGLVLLLSTLLFQIVLGVFAVPNRYRAAFDFNLYRQYTELYGGSYSEHTAKTIAANLSVLEKLSSTRPTLENGTVFDYAAQSERIAFAGQKYLALSAIQEKYSSMAQASDMHPELIYDLELNEYIRLYSLCLSAFLCIALLAPLIMLNDEKCGMQQILFPTATGSGNIVAAKLLTACAVSTIVTAVCLLVQWILFSARWNLGDMSAPIQSVSGFEACTVQISIGHAMLFSSVIQVLGAPVMMLICCTVSLLLRKEAASVAASAVVTGISALLVNRFPDYGSVFLFAPISGIQMFRHAGTVDLIFLVFFLLLRLMLFGTLALYLGTRKR